MTPQDELRLVQRFEMCIGNSVDKNIAEVPIAWLREVITALDEQAKNTLAAREDGWQLVPKKLTPEMADSLRLGSRKDCPSDEMCMVRWVALLAAAPKPQDAPVKGDK